MAMPELAQILFIALAVFLGFLSGSYAEKSITITNECNYTVWPAIAGSMPHPTTTGVALLPEKSYTVSMPPYWTGKVWARTLCSDNITGNFSCVIGDCGSSNIDCGGGNANHNSPVTLAQFTLNGSVGLDYYKVSLMDGFNLPVRVKPGGRTGPGSCRAASCVRDLNQKCPSKLKVIQNGEDVVACKSSCEAHEACKSTLFSDFSKGKCPDAYAHGPFTCASAQYYTVTFCPTSSKR